MSKGLKHGNYENFKSSRCTAPFQKWRTTLEFSLDDYLTSACLTVVLWALFSLKKVSNSWILIELVTCSASSSACLINQSEQLVDYSLLREPSWFSGTIVYATRLLWWLGGKESASASKAGVSGSNPGSGRSPGEGNSYPLQYYCLENSTDRRVWRATVHEVTKSWTQLRDYTFTFSLCLL